MFQILFLQTQNSDRGPFNQEPQFLHIKSVVKVAYLLKLISNRHQKHAFVICYQTDLLVVMAPNYLNFVSGLLPLRKFDVFLSRSSVKGFVLSEHQCHANSGEAFFNFQYDFVLLFLV